MKKQILLVGLALVTAISFGQKKEISKAAKAVKSNDYAKALSFIQQAEGMMGSMDSEMKALFFATKGDVYLGSSGPSNFEKMKMAAEAYLEATKLDPSMDKKIEESIQKLRVKLINSAIDDQNAKKFSESAEKLYTSYSVSKKDTSDLYFAASNAVNAKEYEKALDYYEQLRAMNYTGIAKQYAATNKETGELETFSNEAERDIYIKAKTHIKPEVKVSESRRGEILRNMTLIYFEQDQKDKAVALLQDARKENPDDVTLLRVEANMAYQMGDKKKYTDLMNQVVASDPTNPELYFNLGVGMADQGLKEEALGYYEKALELKPDYAQALINIAVIKISAEKDIVEEMNNLGTSRADNARYDVLKAQRENIYVEVLPTLEKAYNLRPKDVELTRTLMNIYSQVGKDDKFKELKAKLAELEGN